MKYLLSLFLISFLVISVEAQKVKPALNLTKGTTYYLISSTKTGILQTINTENNKINLTLSFKMAFKITDIIDTVYNVEASYESLSFKINTQAGDQEMDSKITENADVRSAIIAAMMNKPFPITITKSGRIGSTASVENMINSTFSDFPQLDTAKRRQLKNQFIQSFGAKALKENLEIATAIFPPDFVKKNKKWTRATTLQSTMMANLQTSYKLVDITNDNYVIHGEGTIVTDNNADAISLNGLPIKYHLAGTMVSDITSDKNTGWVTGLKLRQTMKGDFEIMDNPSVPGGATIPLTIDNDRATTDK